MDTGILQLIRTAVVVVAVSTTMWGQESGTPPCIPDQEFQPQLVENPKHTVTFRCKNATAFDLIKAVGIQTRIPIGVILGRNPDSLMTPVRPYDLKRMPAMDALSLAVRGTGYFLKQEDGVELAVAGDLSNRQKRLLTHQFVDFAPGAGKSMAILGRMLTEWLRAAVNPRHGFAGSILGSTNDERITLRVAGNASTEQIANQIVSQGSKGMWVFRADADQPSGYSTDSIEIQPYQHYTNAPLGP